MADFEHPNGGAFLAPDSKRPARTLDARLHFEAGAWSGPAPDLPIAEWLSRPRHRLSLTPMRLCDLLATWTSASDPDRARTIVIDCEVRRARSSIALETLERLHEGTVAQCGPDVAEGLLVLDDLGLRALASSFEFDRIDLVRVDGPVDAADLRALRLAAHDGGSAIEADLRTTASATLIEGELLDLQTPFLDIAARAVAVDLAQFVAAALRDPYANVPAPPMTEVMRLLGVSGRLRVLPEETECGADGVSLRMHLPAGDDPSPGASQTEALVDPATSTDATERTSAFVFDRPSASWHLAA